MMDDVGLPGKSSAGEHDLTSGQMRPPFLYPECLFKDLHVQQYAEDGRGEVGRVK